MNLSSSHWPWPVRLGWLALAVPTLWDYLFGTWSVYAQGHEILLLAVVLGLMWRQRPHFAPADVAHPLASQAAPSQWPWLLGWGLGLLAYVLGRSQEFIRVELLALWWLTWMLLGQHGGSRALRAAAFPLCFALFAMPLPFSWVLALTAPLKTAVSVVATWLLQEGGYPVARTGVIITVGQYQLLVAEACAGLSSMFTLEAMGLLYSHLTPHAPRAHKLALALLAVPVAFVSNVLRVVVLVLVTYHLGDGVGQGFTHQFAGVLLFGVALALMALADTAMGRTARHALRTGSRA